MMVLCTNVIVICVLTFTVLESQLRTVEALKPAVCGIKIDEICLPGNTLLWDLLQDQNIVSIAVVVLNSFSLAEEYHL